jgi:hypothetical protein
LRSTDGDDLGESTYAVPITPGEEISWPLNGMRFNVLDVVAFEDEAEAFVVLSPFVGLLQVEAASRPCGRFSAQTSLSIAPLVRRAA